MTLWLSAISEHLGDEAGVPLTPILPELYHMVELACRLELTTEGPGCCGPVRKQDLPVFSVELCLVDPHSTGRYP